MKKRVTIPMYNPKQLIALAAKVSAKHQADGANSMLRTFNWESINQCINEAGVFHENAERNKRAMLEDYQQRDLRLQQLLEMLRCCRDVLSGLHHNDMKVLGQWGYEVLERRARKTNKREE